MKPLHVRVFYQTDPVGPVAGGIDTFVRGLIKGAPLDIEFSLVGITADAQARRVGHWTRCRLGEREFNFFPVCKATASGRRGLLPMFAQFCAGVWWHRAALYGGFDIADFHRLEPSLLFAADGRPKNAFIHQDPNTLRSSQSDNRWRLLPGGYMAIECRAMARLSSVWCVRESGAQTLRERYPRLAPRTRFMPTWVDTEVFHGVDETERQRQRQALAQALKLDLQVPWIITVGRLDVTKDPALMLAAFARLHREGRRAVWLVVGDGLLRPGLERAVAGANLRQWVRFVGLKSQPEVASLLRACDAYALTSAYESMPMALLEAMGCGLPPAVTDVGEVRRVVRPGINGAVSGAREPAAFARALAEVLDHAAEWRGAPARDAALVFQPGRVLAPVFENYRQIHAAVRAAQAVAVAAAPVVAARLAATPAATPAVNPARYGIAAIGRKRPVAPPVAQPTLQMNPTLAPRAIEDLLTRIDALLPGRASRVLGFIASSRAEGTSTLAKAYVGLSATLLQRRVLLVTTDNAHSAGRAVLQALVAGRPLDELAQPMAGGGTMLSLGRAEDATLRELLGSTALWQALRSRYDDVVLDLPAASASPVGLSAAVHCDGMVVVVEAEKTRARVVENLVASLAAVHANVLGTVLNRRRYHVPTRIYRWL